MAMPWLVLVLLAATFIAVLRGGRFANFADLHLRYWWLLIVGFAMQAITGLLPATGPLANLGTILILTSYLPLLAVVVMNRHRPGMLLAGLGILANFTVIAANGGMPVLPDAIRAASGFTVADPVFTSPKHQVFGPGTHVGFLADVIPLRVFGQGHVISLGDVLLAIGLGVFLESELRKPVRWFKHRSQSKSGAGSAHRD